MKKILPANSLTGYFITASVRQIEFRNKKVISKPDYEDPYFAGATIN